MPKGKQKPYVLRDITIETVAAEGKAIARHDGKVIFVPFAAPGDIADLNVHRQKKNFAEASILELKKASGDRVKAPCPHFGTCGGCRWQHLSYGAQLAMKERQVADDLQRIAKTEPGTFLPILGSNEQYHYRNKLEFTFSNKAWERDFDKNNPGRLPALGFHIPGMFDKVLDLDTCLLAPDTANRIRVAFRDLAVRDSIPFFDLRQQTGYLRNLMLRCNSDGKWMLVLVCAEDRPETIARIFDELIPEFPEVTEWCHVHNPKRNDTWSDLPVQTYKGNGYLTETMEGLHFRIRPQSFFQTNFRQALELYRITREFAGLTGRENVYDLYTGTGTIALFVASEAAQVTGIEYVEAAVRDARENAVLNQISNAVFYSGDMKEILNEELISRHGKADVVITDPPRDGMHPGVIDRLNLMSPDRIVYVSCNPATQARDIAMLAENYRVEKVRPVDMFPHTHHVESVALLVRKN